MVMLKKCVGGLLASGGKCHDPISLSSSHD